LFNSGSSETCFVLGDASTDTPRILIVVCDLLWAWISSGARRQRWGVRCVERGGTASKSLDFLPSKMGSHNCPHPGPSPKQRFRVKSPRKVSHSSRLFPLAPQSHQGATRALALSM
jgi:hypothetical protein